ncbi:MAG: hypothetical protein PHX54_01170 [Lentimicrobiaceae bacterium]|nr:hypothetical protein [Lentimicrobiaceae bacterium]
MSYGELSRQVGNLRKSKNYKNALPVYEKLYHQYNDKLEEFDIWGYAFCLQKLDQHEQALNISHEGLKRFPNSDFLKNTYSWAIFSLHIQPGPVTDREVFFKAAHAIMKFSDPANKYSPYTLTVFAVIDLLELNYEQHAQSILEWIERLNPEYLDRTPYKFTNKEGKKVVNASAFEKYYAILVKALYETGNYETCIAKADEALSAIREFHNSNEIWIPRNKALSLYALGQHEEGVEILLNLLPRRPEWYIRMEIAMAYEALQMWDKAFKYGLAAIGQKSPEGMKVNLYMLLARLYRQRGQHREACLHAARANQIRNEEGWPEDKEAIALIHQLEPEFVSPTPSVTVNELQLIWADSAPEQDRHQGKIKSVFPNGNAGFITAADGKEYFFHQRDFRGKKELMVKGCSVTFVLVEGFDRKKQKPALNAAEIEII